MGLSMQRRDITEILEGIRARHQMRLDSMNQDIGTYASGNWGHHGLKGQVGGSSKGGGKTNRGAKMEDGTYNSEAKERKLLAEHRKKKNANPTAEDIIKGASKPHLATDRELAGYPDGTIVRIGNDTYRKEGAGYFKDGVDPEKDPFAAWMGSMDIYGRISSEQVTVECPSGSEETVKKNLEEYDLEQEQIAARKAADERALKNIEKKEKAEMKKRRANSIVEITDEVKANTMNRFQATIGALEGKEDPTKELIVYGERLRSNQIKDTIVTDESGETYISHDMSWHKLNADGTIGPKKEGKSAILAGYFKTTPFIQALREKKVPVEVGERFSKALQKCPDDLKLAYMRIISGATFTSEDTGCYYNSRTKKINMGNVFGDDDDVVRVLVHELAHAMDDGGKTLGLSNEISTMLDFKKHGGGYKKDAMEFIESLGLKGGTGTNAVGVRVTSSASEKRKAYQAFREKEFKGVKCVSTIEDIISSLTYDAFGDAGAAGHESGYWANGNMTSKEQWAQYCVLKATNDTKGLKLLKKIAPRLTKSLEDAYSQAMDEIKNHPISDS